MLHSVVRENLSDNLAFDQEPERREGVIHAAIGKSILQAIRPEAEARTGWLRDRGEASVATVGQVRTSRRRWIRKVAGGQITEDPVDCCEDLGFLLHEIEDCWWVWRRMILSCFISICRSDFCVERGLQKSKNGTEDSITAFNGTPLQYSCLENGRLQSMGLLRVGYD